MLIIINRIQLLYYSSFNSCDLLMAVEAYLFKFRAVLKLLRNFAEQLFKASVTSPSYWSSAVLFIALMCGRRP